MPKIGLIIQNEIRKWIANHRSFLIGNPADESATYYVTVIESLHEGWDLRNSYDLIICKRVTVAVSDRVTMVDHKDNKDYNNCKS